MAIDVFALLNENPILLLFTVIGLGHLVASVRIADVPAGPVIGVLLVGLLFGQFGFKAPPGASSFGFALFIFSVGIQAGPTFFSAFAADGVRYVTLACVVAATAVALTLVLTRLVGLEYGLGAGLLAGALTSTPTLAGAQDAVKSGLASLPDALSQAKALQNVSVGYAIAYVFGTVGMILFARLFPRIACAHKGQTTVYHRKTVVCPLLFPRAATTHKPHRSLITPCTSLTATPNRTTP